MSVPPCLRCDDWEPSVVAECLVPWEIIRTIEPMKEYCDFFGPVLVPSDKNGLVKMRFHLRRLNIIVNLDTSNFRNEYTGVGAKVESVVLYTRRDAKLLENKTTHIINSNTYSEPEILNVACSSIRCFTVRLKVSTRKAVGGLPYNLNLARKSGSSLCDIHLLVDSCDFPAHKAVLSATSSVFMAMFTGEFLEKKAASVLINGVSSEAFGLFLDFIYTGDIPSWEGCELELLDLSERYQVEGLKARCDARLFELDGPRALSVLMEAHKWPVLTDAMKNRLCRRVAIGWQSVADSDEWKALQSSNPVASGVIKAFAAIASPSVEVLKAFPPPNKKPATLTFATAWGYGP